MTTVEGHPVEQIDPIVIVPDIVVDDAAADPVAPGPAPLLLVDDAVPEPAATPDSGWTPSQWHGIPLVDKDGHRIGKLEDVYVDVETDQPMFATVKEGMWPGRHLTFVPLIDVHVEPDRLPTVTAQEAGAMTISTAARQDERLQLVDAPTGGARSGTWSPASSDLSEELPGLVSDLHRKGLRIFRVAYNPDRWDHAPRRIAADGRTVRLGWFHHLPEDLLILQGTAGERVDLTVPHRPAGGPALQ